MVSKSFRKLERVKRIEQLTILASIVGVVVPVVHGNLYDYCFNLFSVQQISFNLRILYLSLFLYSALACVVFSSLYVHGEKNPDVRWYNYVQGWAFLVLAVSGYEWVDSSMMEIGAAITTSQTVIENPYTWLTKRYSVIFFGAIFLFWLLETRKKRFSSKKKI